MGLCYMSKINPEDTFSVTIYPITTRILCISVLIEKKKQDTPYELVTIINRNIGLLCKIGTYLITISNTTNNEFVVKLFFVEFNY